MLLLLLKILVDGFAGKALNLRLKDSIKAGIVNVAHVTSNSLALVALVSLLNANSEHWLFV